MVVIKNSKPPEVPKKESVFARWLLKLIFPVLSLVAFLIFAFMEWRNDYHAPKSTVYSLIRGIQANPNELLDNEHFNFSNELIEDLGTEVYKAYQKVDKEGYKIYDRALSQVKNAGRDLYSELSKEEKEEIDSKSKRVYLVQISYSEAKKSNPSLIDSLTFVDELERDNYLFNHGLSVLKESERALIGTSKRKDFVKSKAQFIKTETKKSSEKAANRLYNSILKIYSRIESAGRKEFNKQFALIEKTATPKFNELPRIQRNAIEYRSYNEFLFTEGYKKVIEDIMKKQPDRYNLTKYSADIFLNEEKGMEYRYIEGLKPMDQRTAKILEHFDYTAGIDIKKNFHGFIVTAGLKQLFYTIKEDLSLQAFEMDGMNYRSFDTALLHSDIAEVNTNVGTFTLKLRNGDWHIINYR
jgi:hypothetical protein